MAESYVCSGAMIQCTMGSALVALQVTPEKRVSLSGALMANICDFKPLQNIPSFGPCRSLAYPPTASATSAAQGVLTPMSCLPNIVAPWMPGKADYIVGGMPALTKASTCQCLWGGSIRIVNNGQKPTPPADMSRIAKKHF